MLPLFVATMLGLGAAWAQGTGTTIGAQAVTGPDRLPARIVRTNGKQPVMVARAGKAICRGTSPEEAAAALAMTNSIRRQRGLGPLATSPHLQRAAEAHACDMASRGVMGHAGSDGSGPSARVKKAGYRPRMTAENIAAGHFDLNRVHQEWARSPGHLSNILIKGIQHHGIGYALSADGRSVFWATVYAKSR